MGNVRGIKFYHRDNSGDPRFTPIIVDKETKWCVRRGGKRWHIHCRWSGAIGEDLGTPELTVTVHECDPAVCAPTLSKIPDGVWERAKGHIEKGFSG